jgi:hypothetical protein
VLNKVQTQKGPQELISIFLRKTEESDKEIGTEFYG